jgi:monofunctional biosynthetic peptidoglycan transglycosylase
MRKAVRRSLAGLVALVAAAAAGLVWLVAATPTIGDLATGDPDTTAFIERARATGLRVEWMPVPLDEVAVDLQLAIVVSEDIRFFSHHGFDPIEIRAALREAMTGHRLRGASTITQQLARNLWLSNDRTPTRKVREAALACKLERALSKRRILELYLNTAIFGARTVGVEAAARRYFGVSAAQVTREQAARLAAALPAPSHRYPGSGSPRAERQVERILERMEWPTGLRQRLLDLRASTGEHLGS